MTCKLSILIPSITSREKLLTTLIDYLEEQKDGHPVEILALVDNKEMKVGAKRNELLKMASGQYVTFIDDDDTIAPDYVSSLLKGIESNPDVVCFDVIRYANGVYDRPVQYSILCERDYQDRHYYYRLPNHLMCVKREYALATKFPEINFGEDSDYAKRLKPLLKTEVQIGKVLYNYLYDSRTSKTVNR